MCSPTLPRDNLCGVGKYDPLFEHLCRAGDESLTMTFAEIEALVGALPAAAARQAAWWSNQLTDGRHVQNRSWLNAGREVESVDRSGQRVRFSAPGWRRGA